jgi:UDP-N-acetylmuramoyl-tripeptide--D-alanyl-D-alanine ligase
VKLEVAGVLCDGVSTDTRTMKAGVAFVALKGENHDGHNYVAKAFGLGARAAVVARRVEAAGAQLVVDDPLAWLQEQARRMREAWGGTVIGITGSAGKTTTKDAVAAVLSRRMKTGRTMGNYNNHIGVPLSLVNVADDAEAAVIEIGMNHAGEIRALAGIAQPGYAVVTSVGTAHIEGFSDGIEGITRAKRELVEALPAGGVAILNGDDERVKQFAGAHAGRNVFYGTGEGTDPRACEVTYTTTGSRFQVEGMGWFESSLPARGGLMAALAALAVGREFGVGVEEAREELARLKPEKMRLQRMERNGVTIWDDCYNSNPEAAMMMLELLAATPARRRIAVLGEMLELGRWSEELHRAVGAAAARSGVSLLVGVRGDARWLVDAGRSAGLPAGAACFFNAPEAAARFLREEVKPGDAVLFKGSRGTRVEKVLEEFLRE